MNWKKSLYELVAILSVVTIIVVIRFPEETTIAINGFVIPPGSLIGISVYIAVTTFLGAIEEIVRDVTKPSK